MKFFTISGDILFVATACISPSTPDDISTFPKFNCLSILDCFLLTYNESVKPVELTFPSNIYIF